MEEKITVVKSATRKETTNHTKLVVAIVILAVMCASLLAAMLGYATMAKNRKQTLENMYQQAFYDMTAGMDNIEVKLSKLLVAAGTPQKTTLAENIWRQASLTAESLSSLPINHYELQETYKFVNQLGDYIYTISRRLVKGGSLTEAEEKTVENLYDRAVNLNESLKELSYMIGSGYNFSDQGGKGGSKDTMFGDDMMDNENMGAEYPELIYDGPFSDALDDVDYAALETLEETTQEQAVAYAKERFPDAKTVKYLQKTDTRLAVHALEVDDGYLELTVRGCVPYLYARDRNYGDAKLSREEAIEKSEAWATELFGTELKSVWYNASDNIAYVNLAPMGGDVVYYTDLIKLKIALDDGEIIGLESTAFLINHTQHEAMSPKVSEDQARKALSTKIAVESVRLAVIPQNNGKQAFCYEFYGTYRGYQYIIYVDAASGEEVDILRVIDSDQGAMVE